MDEHLGTDLSLGILVDETRTRFAGPFSRFDLEAVRRQGVWPAETDLGTISGRANLAQALLLRLKTERGELTPLGFADYGSRHLALIGEPNTENTRNRIKLHVLECLRQEPRVEAVLSLAVRPAPGREGRDKVEITVALKAAGDPAPLNLVVPFSLVEGVA